jgi:transcriptional regulator with XRE-family HTH domain
MPLVPYTPQQQLARNIIRKRKILHLNQAELAKLIGTSQTAIARLEAAKGNPTLEMIQRTCNALDLNLILRFSPVGEPEPPLPTWIRPK